MAVSYGGLSGAARFLSSLLEGAQAQADRDRMKKDWDLSYKGRQRQDEYEEMNRATWEPEINARASGYNVAYDRNQGLLEKRPEYGGKSGAYYMSSLEPQNAQIGYNMNQNALKRDNIDTSMYEEVAGTRLLSQKMLLTQQQIQTAVMQADIADDMGARQMEEYINVNYGQELAGLDGWSREQRINQIIANDPNIRKIQSQSYERVAALQRQAAGDGGQKDLTPPKGYNSVWIR